MEWLFISWPTLILLGLGLRMSLRLTYGVRGPEPNDPLYDFLMITSWVLIALGLAPVIIGGIFSVFGLIIVVLFAVTLIEVITQRRAAQRRSLCTLIAVLIERKQRLDLSELVGTESMRGPVGRHARRLFRMLSQGTPLNEAVRKYPRALPDEAIAYLAAGETIHSEAAALRELSRTDHSELTFVWRACLDRITYLAVVTFFMILVMTFIMIKIVPAFRDIFTEFALPLPALTEFAVQYSSFFVRYLASPMAICIALAILTASISGIFYLFDVPIMRPLSTLFFKGRRFANVLRIFALATEERQPLAGVLDRLAQVYPSRWIHRRLARAAAALKGGANWIDALSRARVIRRTEAGLLTTAEKAGNLPWALRQLATRRDRRAIYRLSAAVQIGYPILILLLGSMIGFFVISLFVPLVRLIESLAT
jgi:type II secretory pathway component PulF